MPFSDTRDNADDSYIYDDYKILINIADLLYNSDGIFYYSKKEVNEIT